MRAVLSTDPGGPDTLSIEDVPEPQASAGHVVIDVKAVSVNFPDVLIIEDLYQVKPPRPFSPGAELAGVCLLYTSPSPRDGLLSRMPSSA